MMNRSVFFAIATLALAVLSAWVCIRIELLNNVCNSLPNQEWYDGDPTQGPVTWRASHLTNEARWRKFVLFQKHPEYTDYETRALTENELQSMNESVAKARANNSLLEFVETMGLLQYAMVPAIMTLSILGLRRPRLNAKWIFRITLGIAILCAWRMLSLGYFTSLGW